MNRLIKLTLLLIACAPVALTQSRTPRYKDFPAEVFTGKPAAPVITQKARTFRTRITEGAKDGPNFAGHFRVIAWGCGGSCIQFAIVDSKSGAVYMPPFYVAHGSALKQESLQSDLPLQFKPNSKLLVVVGSRNEKNEGVYFYKWEGGKLILVKSTLEKMD